MAALSNFAWNIKKKLKKLRVSLLLL
jgi:hypothetical protein